MSSEDENPLEIELEVALAEYMVKCDQGQAPDREAFLARHPQMREQLSQILAAADWIEQLAGPTLADLASSPPSSSSSPTRHRPSAQLQGFMGDPLSDETLPHRSTPGPSPSELTLPSSGKESLEFSVKPSFNNSFRTLHSAVPASSSTDSQPESHQPNLPCRFGEYVLERVLGRGGMGVVYFGRQIHLDRPVAIKMIRSGALASSDEVQRFYTEARSAAKLDHPNIVTVYQCGEVDGHHYFSMDYVEGTDLSRMIAEKPLDGKVAARYVRDVARAIQFAHDKGILHRDLKPANVLVDEKDSVHVTDFGLAKSMGHETGLTATGAALGTPSYMSPEQAAGRVDEHSCATDVYSLGAILFTIVTGQPPFRAATTVQTIMHVIHRPAPRASTINPAVDQDLETIIDRCLQKSAGDRYPTAGALADDLDRFLRGQPIQARPMPAWRRAWCWLLGVPIFGAVLDNRVVEPTDAHRWVQRGLIASGLLLVCAWAMFLASSSNWQTNRLPRMLKIAAGAAGGGYDRVANVVCSALSGQNLCEATSMHTEGSIDNIEKLLNRHVDLALLQANSVRSSSIAVVAPLYYEAVHLIARRSSGVASIGDLKGKRILVGGEKSGSYLISQLVLARAKLSLADVQATTEDWRGLASNDQADAAIAVVQNGNAAMQQLLGNHDFHLIPIVDAMDFALEEPTLHALTLTRAMYPESNIADSGVLTVATTAFLAARTDAPSLLVEKVLECLFQPEVVEQCGLMSAERAAHWRGLAWHPAAQQFLEARGFMK